MNLGSFLTWGIHQLFGTSKGTAIVSLLEGPLGSLINATTDDHAQQIVTEVNTVASTGLAELGSAASAASIAAVAPAVQTTPGAPVTLPA